MSGFRGFRLTAYPPDGPYERWELTLEGTGELILAGPWPYEDDAIRKACDAYRAKIGWVACPRRPGINCETPNACVGGADCRLGPRARP
jgi:hypothetical protein